MTWRSIALLISQLPILERSSSQLNSAQKEAVKKICPSESDLENSNNLTTGFNITELIGGLFGGLGGGAGGGSGAGGHWTMPPSISNWTWPPAASNWTWPPAASNWTWPPMGGVTFPQFN